MLKKYLISFLSLALLTFFSHSAYARFDSNQSPLRANYELYHQMLPKPEGMQFQIHPRMDELGVLHIIGRGDIAAGDTERLKSFIAKFPDSNNIVLHLSSGGGSLYAGLELGRYIHNKKIKTAIDPHEKCLSACIFLFYAGSDGKGNPWRASSKTGGLGVHAIRYENGDGQVINVPDGQIQKNISDILGYALDVDIPMSVIQKKFQTEWQGMYYLSEKEKCESNVRIWDGHRGAFSKCPSRRG